MSIGQNRGGGHPVHGAQAGAGSLGTPHRGTWAARSNVHAKAGVGPGGRLVYSPLSGPYPQWWDIVVWRVGQGRSWSESSGGC